MNIFDIIIYEQNLYSISKVIDADHIEITNSGGSFTIPTHTAFLINNVDDVIKYTKYCFKDKVLGFGINDITTKTTLTEKEVKFRDPCYVIWYSMLNRCYSGEFSHYNDCTVSSEWRYLSKFKEWFDTNYIKGFDLDKDLLIKDNKIYSKSTCIFLHHKINTFISGCGNGLVGACYHKRCGKYISSCSNPITGKKVHIGYFDTKEEAHIAWAKEKHKMAILLSESEYCTSDIIKEALINRNYLNL